MRPLSCFQGLNSGFEAGAPAARLPSAAKVLEGLEAWLASSPSAQAVEWGSRSWQPAAMSGDAGSEQTAAPACMRENWRWA